MQRENVAPLFLIMTNTLHCDQERGRPSESDVTILIEVVRADILSFVGLVNCMSRQTENYFKDPRKHDKLLLTFLVLKACADELHETSIARQSFIFALLDKPVESAWSQTNR